MHNHYIHDQNLPVSGPSATTNSTRLHCPLRTELQIQSEKYETNGVGVEWHWREEI